MYVYTARLPKSLSWETLQHQLANINAGIEQLYVWYHTKINTDALVAHTRPLDGVMGDVVRIEPIEGGLKVHTKFTAADTPERFNCHCLINSEGLLGFTLMPR